jgi:peptidoglycan hydrolase-like protein with peptidoglycan-binding domain
MKFRLLLLGLAAATPLAAQSRVTLPAGTVLLARTEQPLESAKAQVGQTFVTTVTEDVSVDGYTVIPRGSAIRGVVSFVQPATRRQSGVMQINFDRLTLPAGTAVTISGRLTSTDSTERRQIDARSDPRVVLVGARGGAGATIAGAGNATGPTTSILGSLSSILSAGADVAVPVGTTLAVQLDRGIVMRVSGSPDLTDESTIFTVTDRIRAAQQELTRRAYYRGTASGVLDNATRRAIYEFQLDNNIRATGNLDRRTARALGILEAADPGDSNVSGVLSSRDAQALRRAAQQLVARQRQTLNNAANVDLYFTLSAFADNASLYEQFVQGNANRNTALMAGRALVNAARRVDTAIQTARAPAALRSQWNSIRQQLQTVDQSYR